MSKLATPVERPAIIEVIVERSSLAVCPEREVDQDGYHLVEHRPTNSWTQKQRETLCLMKATYKNNDVDLAQIFSAMFAEHLRHQGFTNGLRHASLLAQWSDIKKSGAKGHEIWRAFFVDRNFEDVRRDFVYLRNDVEDVARRLRIELILSVDNQEFVVGCTVRKKKKRTRDSIRNVLGDFSSGSDTDEGRRRPPRSTSKRSKAIPNIRTPQRQKASSRVLITPPASGRHYSPPKAFPPLLYRFADSNSQGVNGMNLIRAGLSVDGPSHVVKEAEFEDAALTHLDRKQVSTPFISFFDSLRPSLHRALRSRAEDARVYVTDPSKIIHTYQRRHGTEDGAIFSAKDLILKYKFQLPGAYIASAEYLVWGSVADDAIVASFTMKDLRAYVNHQTEVQDVLQTSKIESAAFGSFLGRRFEYPDHLSAYEIGAITGRFLHAMAFPVDYVEQAAIRFRIKWELRRANIKDFMNGVLDQHPTASSPKAEMYLVQGQEDLTHEDVVSDDVGIIGDTLKDIKALSIEVAIRSEPRTASPGGSPTTIFDDGDYVYVPDGIGHSG